MLRVVVGAARDGLLASALKPRLGCIITKGALRTPGLPIQRWFCTTVCAWLLTSARQILQNGELKTLSLIPHHSCLCSSSLSSASALAYQIAADG